MNIIKELLCRKYCPNYLEDMPKPGHTTKPGPWVAVGLVRTRRKQWEESRKKGIKDFTEAYRQARWLALWLDFIFPDDEYDIYWAVRPEVSKEEERLRSINCDLVTKPKLKQDAFK